MPDVAEALAGLLGTGAGLADQDHAAEPSRAASSSVCSDSSGSGTL